jgi:tRNA (cmo5U34)-methyltransferase
VEGIPQWEESDSARFIRYGAVFTPSRDEQLAMLVALTPAEVDEPFTAVDLGCGAGPLTMALLAAFPKCRVIAMDGSDLMLQTVRERCGEVNNRLNTVRGDLRSREWLQNLPDSVRLIVSSLAIHHLDGAEKQALYADLVGRLEPGGGVFIIDLVQPVNWRAERAYGANWDAIVVAQSIAQGQTEAIELFRQGWNHYVTPDLEFDKPSTLRENLQWLDEAGLTDVDCFWLRAGHALYGGYREGS